MSTFGSRLKELRQGMELSQRGLSKECQRTSGATICQLEQDLHSPKLSTILDLISGLSLTRKERNHLVFGDPL